MFKLWLFHDFIFHRTSEGKEYLRLREVVKKSTEPLLEAKKREMAEDEKNSNTSKLIIQKFFNIFSHYFKFFTFSSRQH